ncbi:hypothetical protein IGI37_003347 [Enterococcus sp. AZ194]|uniref:WxL domain-containing protein n=1 Tax=Enterococcus sp. AZ194 TaxID=2774629 RepID=UPI003F275C6B
MKKTTVLTAGIILFGSLLGASSAFAGEKGDRLDSTAKITFQAGTSGENPLDPKLPNPERPIIPVNPINPEKPVTPGTDGPLSIDYVSDFQFNVQQISTKDQTYNAAPQAYTTFDGESTTGPNFVQVTDTRGTQTGWQLRVTQNAQFKTAENEELVGAKLNFANGHAISNQQNDLDETQKAAITPTVLAETTDKDLTPGVETVIMTAEAGKGAGTWLYDMGTEATAAESVKLSVPGKSSKLLKAYTSTLTWTLSNTPK